MDEAEAECMKKAAGRNCRGGLKGKEVSILGMLCGPVIQAADAFLRIFQESQFTQASAGVKPFFLRQREQRAFRAAIGLGLAHPCFQGFIGLFGKVRHFFG
ncbi:MAG: hypothetical protein J5865_08735 [Lachnospiraceae bacterium]|nr:hypothetical protein [Lachnospiraceae bacterium]